MAFRAVRQRKPTASRGASRFADSSRTLQVFAVSRLDGDLKRLKSKVLINKRSRRETAFNRTNYSRKAAGRVRLSAKRRGEFVPEISREREKRYSAEKFGQQCDSSGPQQCELIDAHYGLHSVEFEIRIRIFRQSHLIFAGKR